LKPATITPDHRRHPDRPARYLPPAVEFIELLPLPRGLDSRSLRRRALQIAVVLGTVGAVAVLAPGLGDVRRRLEGAQPGWLGVAVVLELLSCLSYVLMFRPIFCARMSQRTSYQLAMSELAVGSLVPASGAAGLAFGAWALRKAGVPAHDIARRTVAFFVLKSAVNFVAVVVIGVAMWLGVGPHVSPALTLLPAGLAVVAIAAVSLIPWVQQRRRSKNRIAVALGDGIGEAAGLLARRDWRVIAGSAGYWAFDNAVLWACLHAFGETPPLTLVLMGYLIGQLGGLLPIPGGLGGVDGGLLGALVVYGLPVAAAAAAILAYRLILFWLPLILGGAAFASLRRSLLQAERLNLCDPHVAL
jgi:uncharacterized membrane protein YbhN (UPF0104 family)